MRGDTHGSGQDTIGNKSNEKISKKSLSPSEKREEEEEVGIDKTYRRDFFFFKFSLKVVLKDLDRCPKPRPPGKFS